MTTPQPDIKNEPMYCNVYFHNTTEPLRVLKVLVDQSPVLQSGLNPETAVHANSKDFETYIQPIFYQYNLRTKQFDEPAEIVQLINLVNFYHIELNKKNILDLSIGCGLYDLLQEVKNWMDTKKKKDGSYSKKKQLRMSNYSELWWKMLATMDDIKKELNLTDKYDSVKLVFSSLMSSLMVNDFLTLSTLNLTCGHGLVFLFFSFFKKYVMEKTGHSTLISLEATFNLNFNTSASATGIGASIANTIGITGQGTGSNLPDYVNLIMAIKDKIFPSKTSIQPPANATAQPAPSPAVYTSNPLYPNLK